MPLESKAEQTTYGGSIPQAPLFPMTMAIITLSYYAFQWLVLWKSTILATASQRADDICYNNRLTRRVFALSGQPKGLTYVDSLFGTMYTEHSHTW